MALHCFFQAALQMDEPGCPLRTDVTTLSMETKTKSKATALKMQKLTAKALVDDRAMLRSNVSCV